MQMMNVYDVRDILEGVMDHLLIDENLAQWKWKAESILDKKKLKLGCGGL
jgi:hypothetical protein